MRCREDKTGVDEAGLHCQQADRENENSQELKGRNW
jgi:hypothetical protein